MKTEKEGPIVATGKRAETLSARAHVEKNQGEKLAGNVRTMRVGVAKVRRKTPEEDLSDRSDGKGGIYDVQSQKTCKRGKRKRTSCSEEVI